MTDYTLPADYNQTSGGIETIIYYLIDQVDTFGIFLLVTIFLVLLGAGYFSQSRRGGNANFPMWLTIASFITTIVAFILFLVPGILNLEVVIMMMILSMLSALWFLFSDRE